ncbi:hypothetical protein, partial [Pseudomonas sp. FG-3G]
GPSLALAGHRLFFAGVILEIRRAAARLVRPALLRRGSGQRPVPEPRL